MGFESSRIYVELHKVLGKLDFNAYNASIIAKEDEFRRKRRHFDKAIIERDTTFALVTKYLLSRLAVHREGSSLTQPYTIYLKPQLGDVLLASSVTCAIDGACPSGVMLDGLISKPDSLIPIVTNHYFQQTVTSEVLMKSVQALKDGVEEHKQLHPTMPSSSKSTVVVNGLLTPEVSSRRPPRVLLGDSLPKIRWQWAVSKILFRITCVKVRAMLKKRQERELLVTRKSSRSNKVGNQPLGSSSSPILPSLSPNNHIASASQSCNNQDADQPVLLPALKPLLISSALKLASSLPLSPSSHNNNNQQKSSPSTTISPNYSFSPSSQSLSSSSSSSTSFLRSKFAYHLGAKSPTTAATASTTASIN